MPRAKSTYYFGNLLLFSGLDGESAGARTQDQRLKRAMLYQLSYALSLFKLAHLTVQMLVMKLSRLFLSEIESLRVVEPVYWS